MSNPLFRLGTRRTAETLTESLVPMAVAGYSVWAARSLLRSLTASRPYTTTELMILLGAVVAAVSWYAGRQMVIIGSRKPFKILTLGYILSATSIGLLMIMVRTSFDNLCTDVVGLVLESGLLFDQSVPLCQVAGVPGNVYLPGTLLQAGWDGHLGFGMFLWLFMIATLGTLGLREWRLRPTRLGAYVAESLRLAPSAGSASIAYEKPGDGAIQACRNATLWGEICGQMYSAEREFEPGEWCVRCAQVYRPARRTVTFKVVSLFTSDIDVLNGLERMDSQVWPMGQRQHADARVSGIERWVKLGTITVPDVISVATLLSLVHEQLPRWGGEGSERMKDAIDLATVRASKIAAWIWFGSFDDALTYARPTHRALLAVGPSRLRDLPLDQGEELILQLDIGLLPLELRTGFRQTFMDPNREPILQNSKQDVWIRTARPSMAPEGLWVPRLEGEALRTWLSMDRIRPAEAQGVTTPTAYWFGKQSPENLPASREGSIDIVRMPLGSDGLPLEVLDRPGISISEWTWMQWRMLELLRQEALVMVSQ